MRTVVTEREFSGNSRCPEHAFGNDVKKKALEKQGEAETITYVEEGGSYRVDGEVGRFTFATHHVMDWDGNKPFRSHDLFPEQRGEWYYPTRGFKEFGLFHGAVDQSYRKTVTRMNAQRRQVEGGTPVTTHRSLAEREGTAVVNYWSEKSANLLKRHGFTEEGEPAANRRIADEKQFVEATSTHEQVDQAIADADIASELMDEVRSNPVPYENPDATVEISVDGVLTKRQKPHRGSEPSDAEKKRVNNRVAHIRHQGQSYCLVAAHYLELLRFVLAFLLHNRLWQLTVCFYVDGERALTNAIVTLFSWHPHVRFVMDWYHLEHKCQELLSLALKGRKIRNEHLESLREYLWHGCVPTAIEYLRGIPPNHIKNMSSLEKLIQYLENHRIRIPCYAVRKHLGLCNSSNRVEKCNDQLVSQRQKHNGMSWSDEGSLGLAALSAIRLNGSHAVWLEKHVIPFRLMSKAA